jgi:CHASE2 domain-containing sensor protein
VGKGGRRRKSRAAARGGLPPVEPRVPAARGRFKRFAREALTGLFFAALILGAKLLIEHTRFGQQLDAISYNLLQLRLASEHAPVKLIDISELRPAPFDVDGQTGIATPREPLRAMIEALTQKEGARPKAIGVDIDFSPEGDQYVHPRDPEFFQFCLDTSERTGVPIYLGVGRTNTRPAEDWLGGEEYQRLAADVSIPMDRRKVVRWVKAGEDGQRLMSMSVLLADAYARGAGQDSRGWWGRVHNALLGRLEESRLVESVGEKELAPGLQVGEFLVDFSPLDRLKETKLRTANPAVVADQAEQFKGKVVLLGDATVDKAEDPFPVPGRDEYFSGVYLHACAVNTLVAAPLYEVTHKGRVVIDVILSAGVILAVALVGLYFAGRTERKVASHRLKGLLIVFAVLAALAVGVLFVRVTRLMWSDFILALGMLAMHPSIEKRLHGLWGWLRGRAPAAVDSIVFEPSGEEERHR